MDNTQEGEHIYELSPMSLAYLNVLAQPYIDALTAATTIESVVEWLPAVVPERANEIVTALAELPDVESAKMNAISWIQDLLVQYVLKEEAAAVNKLIPWDLARHRDEMLTRLFGPATAELPISVAVGTNSFSHNMTEELAYGLAVGLQGHPEIGLYFNNVPITSADFDLKFKGTIRPYKYRVIVGDEEYYFNTPDFIQGIKTAAEWTGRKPQEIATNLVGGGTAMTFN